MKKDIKLIVFPVLAIVLIGLGIFFFSQKKEQEVTQESTFAPTGKLYRDTAYSKGPADAKVTVVEFFDPECEGCGAFHPILMKVLSEFPNDVRLVARYMLFHGNSYQAALALEGAGKQGKYWEMYNFLLERQNHWGHQKDSVAHIFEMYAKELKLDIEAFNKSYQDMSHQSVLAQDMNDGKALAVRGTPTFFINGKMLQRLSYQDLKEAIANELKQK